MRRCLKLGFWIALGWLNTGTLCAQTTAEPVDTMKVDTLREVTVHGNIQMPLSGSLKQDVNLLNSMQKYSLNGIIQRVAPMLHDQIMHPFGFAERKKVRKRKKVQRILEQYDAVGSTRDPMEVLLDSLAKEQGVVRKKH